MAIDGRLTWDEYIEQLARSLYEMAIPAAGYPSFDKLDQASRERWVANAETIFDRCQH